MKRNYVNTKNNRETMQEIEYHDNVNWQTLTISNYYLLRLIEKYSYGKIHALCNITGNDDLHVAIKYKPADVNIRHNIVDIVCRKSSYNVIDCVWLRYFMLNGKLYKIELYEDKENIRYYRYRTYEQISKKELMRQVKIYGIILIYNFWPHVDYWAKNYADDLPELIRHDNLKMIINM